MIYGYILINVFVTVLWLKSALGAKKTCYKAMFSDTLDGCPDFKNNFIDCQNMELGKEDDEGSVIMEGIIDLKKPIDVDIEVEMTAYKQTEQGEDMSFSTVGNICTSVEDENTPWFPMLSAMNATKCPIPAKVYNVSNMEITLAFLSEIINHEFVGEYRILVKFIRLIEVLSCYVFHTEIQETSCDEKTK